MADDDSNPKPFFSPPGSQTFSRAKRDVKPKQPPPAEAEPPPAAQSVPPALAAGPAGRDNGTTNDHAKEPAPEAPVAQAAKPTHAPPPKPRGADASVNNIVAQLSRRYAQIPDGRYEVVLLPNEVNGFDGKWKSGVAFTVGIVDGQYTGHEIELQLITKGEATMHGRIVHDLTMLRDMDLWIACHGWRKRRAADAVVRQGGAGNNSRIWLTIASEIRGGNREARIMKVEVERDDGWNLPGYAFTICMVSRQGTRRPRRSLGSRTARCARRTTTTHSPGLCLGAPKLDSPTLEMARHLAGPKATANMAMTIAPLRQAPRMDDRDGRATARPQPEESAAEGVGAPPNRIRCLRCRAPGCPSTATTSKCRTALVPATAAGGRHLHPRHLLPPEFANVECVGVATASRVSRARHRAVAAVLPARPAARAGAAAQLGRRRPARRPAGRPVGVAGRPADLHGKADLHQHGRSGAAEAMGLRGPRPAAASASSPTATTPSPQRSSARSRPRPQRRELAKLLDATLGGPTSFFEPLTKALGLAAHTAESEDEIAALSRCCWPSAPIPDGRAGTAGSG